jgi:short subunit dehydrogenase-like uncharacterized protein
MQCDVVLMGATGFTGKLVAEYLADRAHASPFRWALAGRNEVKLEGLRRDLGVEVDVILADSGDRDALDALVGQTRCVASTVGPYAKYGSELVAACVDSGTHYCDLTGEPQWVRRMIDAHHDRAAETGARIVHCCGFDSIPSDIGTLLLQERAIADTGRPCDAVSTQVVRMKGGASGGTIASMFNLLEEPDKRFIREVLTDPYSLNPPGLREGPDAQEAPVPRRDPLTGDWTGPFVMAAINERIVRRTNALLGFRYGRDLRYTETVRKGTGLKGFLGSATLSASLGALMLGTSLGPTRRLLQRLAPSPGEGPSRKAIESGFFAMEVVGAQDGQAILKTRVEGDRDPGYGATACMLAESALCLALDDLDSPCGVLTPASAMGRKLADRLTASQVRFEVRGVTGV